MSKAINLNVEEFTSENLFCADRRTKLSEIDMIMNTEEIRHVPITDDNGEKIVGIISKRDLDSIDIKELTSLNASDIMVTDPLVVSRTEKIQDVAFMMSNRKVGSAIVEEDGKPYGIFTTTDALNALVEVVRGVYS